MSKFFRLLLQAIGLVRKYEPVAEEVVREAKPLVKDLLDKKKGK
jgi:hypothetical protein